MRSIHFDIDQFEHSAPITHVGFSADGCRLATSSYDGTVLVWDTTEPHRLQPVARLYHRRLVNASAWNPQDKDVLATASADKTVAVWRLDGEGSAQVVATLARHTDDINSVAWMPDGVRLICVSEDGGATLWDAMSGRFLSAVAAHAAHCMMVSVSKQGIAATVGEDGMVAVFAPDGGVSPVSRHYESSVEGCAWSPSGDALAIARDDGVVDVLGPDLEVQCSARVSTSAAIRTVSWSDERTLVVGSYDGRLYVVDRNGALLGTPYSDDRIWPRSIATAGRFTAAGSFWSTPHLLDVRSGTELVAPTRATHGPNALAVWDGTVYVGCDSGVVLQLPLAVLAEAVRAPGRPSVVQVAGGPVLALAASAVGLFAGTYSGEVVRFDGKLRRSARLGAPVPSLATAFGGLLAGTYNGELIRLDPAQLVELDRSQAHDGSVKSLAMLHDDCLISAGTDRAVSAGGAGHRNVLWEHGNLVNAVATLGGSVVASAARDHTVKVGRVTRAAGGQWTAGSPVRSLLGPNESVKAVAILGDPAAPTVLAGSYDFRVYAWQVDWAGSANQSRWGKPLFDFDQAVSCMAPVDDRRVLAAGWDGRLILLEARPRGGVEVVGEVSVPELVERAIDTELVSP